MSVLQIPHCWLQEFLLNSRYLFRSGNIKTSTDKFHNITVEVLPSNVSMHPLFIIWLHCCHRYCLREDVKMTGTTTASHSVSLTVFLSDGKSVSVRLIGAKFYRHEGEKRKNRLDTVFRCTTHTHLDWKKYILKRSFLVITAFDMFRTWQTR